MRYKDFYPSQWFTAADLDDQPLGVKIESTKEESVGYPVEQKCVVRFTGETLALVLNKTNFRMIETLHGEDTDDWVGKQVELYPTTVEFQGKEKPCIRVRGPSGGLGNDHDLASFG